MLRLPDFHLATGQEKVYISPMKKTFFLCIVVCLVFRLVLAAAGAGAEDKRPLTPLPDDVKIEPPAPGVSPEVAGLSGIWQGDLEVC